MFLLSSSCYPDSGVMVAACSRHTVDDLLHNLQLCPSHVPLDAISPQSLSFSPSPSVLLVDTSHRWEAVFTHFFIQPFKVQISILPDNLAVQIHKLVFRSCQMFGANYRTANQDVASAQDQLQQGLAILFIPFSL